MFMFMDSIHESNIEDLGNKDIRGRQLRNYQLHDFFFLHFVQP